MLNSEVRLTFESTSGLKKRNVSRGLDIRTGVFTVEEGHGGIWSVSYSIKSQQHSGETNTAYLYLNDQRIEESYHFTSYYGQVEIYPGLSFQGAYNRSFLCMEATYPYAIKNQLKAPKGAFFAFRLFFMA